MTYAPPLTPPLRGGECYSHFLSNIEDTGLSHCSFKEHCTSPVRMGLQSKLISSSKRRSMRWSTSPNASPYPSSERRGNANDTHSTNKQLKLKRLGNARYSDLVHAMRMQVVGEFFFSFIFTMRQKDARNITGRRVQPTCQFGPVAMRRKSFN